MSEQINNEQLEQLAESVKSDIEIESKDLPKFMNKRATLVREKVKELLRICPMSTDEVASFFKARRSIVDHILRVEMIGQVQETMNAAGTNPVWVVIPNAGGLKLDAQLDANAPGGLKFKGSIMAPSAPSEPEKLDPSKPVLDPADVLVTSNLSAGLKNWRGKRDEAKQLDASQTSVSNGNAVTANQLVGFIQKARENWIKKNGAKQ